MWKEELLPVKTIGKHMIQRTPRLRKNGLTKDLQIHKVTVENSWRHRGREKVNWESFSSFIKAYPIMSKGRLCMSVKAFQNAQFVFYPFFFKIHTKSVCLRTLFWGIVASMCCQGQQAKDNKWYHQFHLWDTLPRIGNF